MKPFIFVCLTGFILGPFSFSAESALSHSNGLTCVNSLAAATEPLAVLSDKLDSNNGFRLSQLRDIHHAAKEVYDLTNDNDTIVILGRSPYWIGKFLLQGNAKRKIVFLPFSNARDIASISAESIRGFRNYMTQLGLSPEDIVKSNGRIVAVDHTQSGDTLRTFISIWNQWARDEKTHAFPLTLIYPHMSPLPVEFATDRGLVIQIGHLPPQSGHQLRAPTKVVPLSRDTMVPLANNDSSFGTSYRPDQWNMAPVFSEPTPTEDKLSSQIKDYISAEGAIFQ